MKQAFGEAGLDQFLEIRTREQIQAYRAIVSRYASLQRQLQRT
jgi:hypothetical protein